MKNEYLMKTTKNNALGLGIGGGPINLQTSVDFQRADSSKKKDT